MTNCLLCGYATALKDIYIYITIIIINVEHAGSVNLSTVNHKYTFKSLYVTGLKNSAH